METTEIRALIASLSSHTTPVGKVIVIEDILNAITDKLEELEGASN